MILNSWPSHYYGILSLGGTESWGGGRAAGVFAVGNRKRSTAIGGPQEGQRAVRVPAGFANLAVESQI